MKLLLLVLSVLACAISASVVSRPEVAVTDSSLDREFLITKSFNVTFSVIKDCDSEIKFGCEKGNLPEVIKSFTLIEKAFFDLSFDVGNAFTSDPQVSKKCAGNLSDIFFKLQEVIQVTIKYPSICFGCRYIFTSISFQLTALFTLFKKAGVDIASLIQQNGEVDFKAWASIGFSFGAGGSVGGKV